MGILRVMETIHEDGSSTKSTKSNDECHPSWRGPRVPLPTGYCIRLVGRGGPSRREIRRIDAEDRSRVTVHDDDGIFIAGRRRFWMEPAKFRMGIFIEYIGEGRWRVYGW